MQSRLAVLCCACATLYLQPAIAQQQARANPADLRTEIQSPRYQSAFDGYQAFRDEKLAPWREVNDAVGRVGGQAGIFGGAGHAGHSDAKSVTNTPTPVHGQDHQGMTQ